MTGPSPPGSHALLIGTSNYPNDPSLGDRPAVRRNLDDLRAVLTDPAIGGLPPDHCHVLAEPPDRQTIAEKLDEVAEATTGVFIVYFAGHGLLDDETHDLHLGVRSSTQRLVADTSFPYTRLPSRMRLSRAISRVIILDCCFSGLATETTLAGTAATMAAAQMNGAFTLTSTSAIMPAFSLPDEKHTAFTGRLLHILRNGVPGGPENLDLDTLYHRLYAELRAADLPQPRKLARDGGSDVPLARNVAWQIERPRAPTPTTATPPMEAGIEVVTDELLIELPDDAYLYGNQPDPPADVTPTQRRQPRPQNEPTPTPWTMPQPGAPRPGPHHRPPATTHVRLGGPEERLGIPARTLLLIVAIVVLTAVVLGLLALT